ncbi:hypothetical protein BDV06DRAFT_233909 [Aspergillus oleicola]
MDLRSTSRKRRRASTILDSDFVADSNEESRRDDESMGSPSGSGSGSESWDGIQDGGGRIGTASTMALDATRSTTGTSVLPPDQDGHDAQSNQDDQDQRPRTKFIVGLDYGTTFSSVSYIKFDPTKPPKTLRGEEINSISDWPHAGSIWRNPDVPSESWYLDGELFWGYNAREAIKGIQNNDLDYKNRIIQCAKLMLSTSQRDTEGPQDELRRTLHKANKDHKDVIRDYIREILLHSKGFLESTEALDEECEVEVVFCTPAGWTAKAIRDMQEIVLDVAQGIKFGKLLPLYILNEPEAAAAYILEALPGSRDLKVGDVFIVCDAGGGTVDTITYRVRRERPFRVEEVVIPTGSNCGSSYVNRKLKSDAIERIKRAPYVALKAPSPEYVLEHDLMNDFEYHLKKKFDPAKGLDGDESFVMHGLQRDAARGFGNSLLYVSRRRIAGYFQWCLDRISKLIHGQIDLAKEKGLTVQLRPTLIFFQKVLLVGGFSQAPIFQSHIAKEFNNLENISPIKLDTASTVSHGAVFRALNKADGPKRIIQSNFGFYQIEEYSPKVPAHRGICPTQNEVDGKKYVYNVLDWVIKKNQVLRKKQPFRTRNYQTFKMDEELVITQRIYVSDFDNAKDHYKATHKYNRGAEIFGILQVDLQRVKEEGLLEVKSGPKGNFYELHYELGMDVDGRNLTVKLYCPPGGQCRGQTQLCIAAAFMPGTE